MDIGYTLKKGIKYVQHYGVKEVFTRMHEKQDSQDISYEEFCKQEAISSAELERQKKECKSWSNRPLISVVCVASLDEQAQEYMSDQLTSQTYDRIEFCVAPTFLEGIEKAKGEYMAFLEPMDSLAPNAIYEVALVIMRASGYECEHARQSGLHWEYYDCLPNLIYTDEDQGENYCMKPDFSPAMLEEVCYIKHFLVVSKDLALKVLFNKGNVNLKDNNLMMASFACSCAEQAKYIYHIPKVLYHCSTELKDMGMKSVGVHQEDQELDNLEFTVGSVVQNKDNFDPIISKKSEQPLISIIIPNKDQKETLEKCLNSIHNSTYTSYEIIVVENNSTTKEIFNYYKSLSEVSVVTWTSQEHIFNFSAINNYGVSHARGDYLVFLNNDIEIITPDWLERLLADCQRPNTAIAGAKLYYPDNTIQHAGIIVGIGGHARGIAANMCVGLDRNDPGYMNRASIRQNMSAVTAACMMMRRDVFEEIGGFTEYLTVAFNDVDLCLKARKAGYEIIYDPYVEAYHYESKSRGMEDTPEKVRRFQTEIEYMRTEWEDILKEGDPYYNPNLSRYRFDYSLRRGK